MRRRQASPSALLAQIRGFDFAAFSDAALREAFVRLETQAGAAAAEGLLPECFAIVIEAVDRRLGAWRLLDESQPMDIPCSDEGGGDEGAFADDVASVSEQRGYRRPGDILLPAAFYRAARQHDAGGLLRFLATDEQLLAACHLFRGRVVQMDAGEGKTVAIAIAAALHAVLGRCVHVITANDYLAERDAALLEPVYRSLGLSSGAVPAHMEEAERRQVYGRHIVYGAMRELGFDHLRDQLKTAQRDRVQLPLDVAIVDEADHALIDEAFTPLIISGNPLGSNRTPVRVNAAVAGMVHRQRESARGVAGQLAAQGARPSELQRLAATLLLADPDNSVLLQEFAARPRLRRQAWALAEEEHADLTGELYYAVHPGRKQVTLTERGRELLEEQLGPVFGGNVPVFDSDDGAVGRRSLSLSAARREARRHGLTNQVSQALRAHLVLQRDVDYLVDDDSIVLIDPHTGRPKPDSIYQHGLQAAVEAREGVTVQPERETLAQISVSGFVSQYRQLAGITGTALTAAGEFRRKYGLEVSIVPPVHAPKRVNRPPVVYETTEDKLAAVVDEVAARHRTGQPVLVGTRTVEQSEELSRLLENRGVPHRVLNAVTTHVEAGIVRGTGAIGAVTVATHMAGRGTDILLEPGLDARVAGQCTAEIQTLLSGEIKAVEVGCASDEQADLLELEITGKSDGKSDLVVTRLPGESVLRVSPAGNDCGHVGVARVEFAMGLCVIGTEVHDSSRITLQLNGRSGRQGQFGLTRTYLSLEDRLVNLDADAILRLTRCRQADASGRVLYTGPEVSRRIELLQDAADREGESQRALMQDYASEFDRQTNLYHQRREDVIQISGAGSGAMRQSTGEILERVASRIVTAHLGADVDGDYPLRFGRLQAELGREYAVDCGALYGGDLSLLSGEIVHLISLRLDEQAREAGDEAFSEVMRLLYLQACSDLWPGHIAALRDSVAVEMLGTRGHKSAVASHISRSNGELSRFWVMVEEEFLSRLCTLPVAVAQEPPPSPVAVSSETELLLSRYATPGPNEG